MRKNGAFMGYARKLTGAGLPLIWLALSGPTALAQAPAANADAVKRFTSVCSLTANQNVPLLIEKLRQATAHHRVIVHNKDSLFGLSHCHGFR